MPPPAELLPWDTEFWGVRIGRVVGERMDAALAADVEEWARSEDVSCVYFLAHDEPETVFAAEDARFRLVEARIRQTHEGVAEETPGETRPAREDDLPAIRELARRTRYVSRFDFDPRFPPERVVDYYEAWAVRSLEGWADAVLVAEADGRLAGYITCRLAAEGVDATFGIVAVDENERRSGVAGTLLMDGVRWLQARGMRTVSVEVAARNVRTQRYVQRYGFRSSAFGLYFHRWYR